jgi:hypothetical protein
LNTKSDYSSDIKVDLVEQGILSYHTLIHLMIMLSSPRRSRPIIISFVLDDSERSSA